MRALLIVYTISKHVADGKLCIACCMVCITSKLCTISKQVAMVRHANIDLSAIHVEVCFAQFNICVASKL